jgi:hypothetical protein
MAGLQRKACIEALRGPLQERRAVELLRVRMSSRAFPSGFEIATPLGNFSAREQFLSPLSEILIANSSGVGIARLRAESFLSSVCDIIISGGGFYQFGRDRKVAKSWVCKGEGRLLRLIEGKKRTFHLATDEAQAVAECVKDRFSNNYTVDICDQEDLKLVICIFIALSRSEHQNDPPVI